MGVIVIFNGAERTNTLTYKMMVLNTSHGGGGVFQDIFFVVNLEG